MMGTETRKIITPQEFHIPRKPPVGRITMKRKPQNCTCTCRHLVTVAVPNAAGKLEWSCPNCGGANLLEFRHEDQKLVGQMALRVQRAPVQHKCSCGEEDIIMLPVASGNLIWKCRGKDCDRKWRIAFNPHDGQLGRAV